VLTHVEKLLLSVRSCAWYFARSLLCVPFVAAAIVAAALAVAEAFAPVCPTAGVTRRAGLTGLQMAHHVNAKGAKEARKNRPRKACPSDINRKPPPYDVEPMIAARKKLPEYEKIGEADVSGLTKIEKNDKVFYHVKTPFTAQ